LIAPLSKQSDNMIGLLGLENCKYFFNEDLTKLLFKIPIMHVLYFKIVILLYEYLFFKKILCFLLKYIYQECIIFFFTAIFHLFFVFFLNNLIKLY